MNDEHAEQLDELRNKLDRLQAIAKRFQSLLHEAESEPLLIPLAIAAADMSLDQLATTERLLAALALVASAHTDTRYPLPQAPHFPRFVKTYLNT